MIHISVVGYDTHTYTQTHINIVATSITIKLILGNSKLGIENFEARFYAYKLKFKLKNHKYHNLILELNGPL